LSEIKRNVVNQWYDNTLYSRLDDKSRDVIILVMQHVHTDDLVTHVKAKEHWEHINLPAIAEVPETFTFSTGKQFDRQIGDVLQPNREPLEILDKIKNSIGKFNFTTQYQQRPIPLKGNLIQREWFNYYENMPPIDDADYIIQSWDTAGTTSELSSYSVCTTWRRWGKDYHLIDVFRERMDYPTLRKKVYLLAHQFRPRKILIEEKATGTSLIQEMQSNRMQGIPYPTSIIPKEDKVIRMSTASYLIESGHVYLPINAPWLAELINELLAFPNGKHDDQVDSISQFLNWIDERQRDTIKVVPLYGG
jgi:predicted phage terminase large subunit-like protein